MTLDVLPERPPERGELVQVRSRRWLVEDVRPTSNDTSIVALACADDDAQGEELEVLWNYELDRRILEGEAWEDLASRGFDDPRHFAAFLNTLRWNTVTATDPNLFQAPFRAGITIDAYQMEPLRKALRLPRVNLFIADDTGLGKTIEAGLIARELLLRNSGAPAPQEGEDDRCRCAAVGAGTVAGRAGGAVRTGLRDPRPPIHGRGPP